MPESGLAEFIDKDRAEIVAEWETFARTLTPAATGQSGTTLRDHADDILTAIVHDMRSRQSGAEQAEKSKGQGEAQNLLQTGQIHAALRIEHGFKLAQIVAEYRALRASVHRLWKGTDPVGVTRFNEAIDEALAQAVERFTETTEHFRDQSLGILGHDLRNPLSAIIAGSTLLLHSKHLDPAGLRTVSRMLNSATRMSRMIADLLDLTRTRLGDAIPIQRAAIDLDPLCRQVVAEFDALAPGGHVSYVGRGDLRGDWDADRVAQALSNLVRNAIQHGSKTDPVQLVATDEGDAVALVVHNRGVAIAEAALNTVFEPMVRHAGEDSTNAGLGLGLYIASQVVAAHGGKLTVTSTEADGTTFTVMLPRRAPAQTHPAG